MTDSDHDKAREGAGERFERRREEALHTLDRVGAESETLAGSTFVRMAERARGHMSADDRPQDDPIEVWGTRIGRGLGVIFAIGLVIYLVVTYL